MRQTDEEKGLLAKFASGVLAGMVGVKWDIADTKMFTAEST